MKFIKYKTNFIYFEVFYLGKIKKILFIWPTLSKGGAEKVMLDLVSQLQINYEITILVKFHICEFSSLPKVNLIYSDKKRYNGVINKILNRVFFYISIFRLVRCTDIVISKEVIFGLIPSFIASKLFKKYFIVWNHSNLDVYPVVRNNLERKLHKFILANVDRVINVSKYAEASLFDYIGHKLDHSLVIYNHISETVFSEQIKQSSMKCSNGETVKIIIVGRLSKEKNFELALLALNDLVKLHLLDIKLIICGEGEQRSSIEAIVKQNNLEDYVILTGLVHNVIDYIQDSHILISTSNTESFGMTVIEGLACSKPVIITNTGAVEILDNGKYGYIININDKSELINKILEVINNYDIALEKARLGYLSLSRFSGSAIIRQWDNLFDEIIFASK